MAGYFACPCVTGDSRTIGSSDLRQEHNPRMKSAAVEGFEISTGDTVHCREQFHDSNVMDSQGVPVEKGGRRNVDGAADLREEVLQAGIPVMFDVADVDIGVHPEGDGITSNQVPP
jgi:hypothetical protein